MIGGLYRDSSRFGRNVRSMKVELRSYRDDNENLIKAQEKQTELNVVLLQSLSEIQKHLQQGPTTIQCKEDKVGEVVDPIRNSKAWANT
jgi:hypothetical protein